MRVNVKRGLNLRPDGAPEQRVIECRVPGAVALMPDDFPGTDLRASVAVGDRVARGQPLLTDHRHAELVLTSPVSGTVSEVARGTRRRPVRVVVSAEGDRTAVFPRLGRHRIAALGAAEVRQHLLASGLWAALRARPFELVAPPDVTPRALYVTAIDTRPLAPDPVVVLAGRHEEFAAGIAALAKLPSGPTFLCVAPGSAIDVTGVERVQRVEFGGPHPAGLPGTHMHAVGPGIGREPDLWHIGYQDVAAFGHLLLRGRIDARRVIAVAGPGVSRPALYRVPAGSRVADLPLPDPATSRSIVAGPLLVGAPARAYLGRYDLQVSVLPAVGEMPRSHAIWRSVARRVRRAPTDAHAMLPVERFERVWPFRTPPSAVLRTLLVGDPEDAVRVGVLGLAEEDLSLCELVCPASVDYSAALRATLARMAAQ